MGPILVAGEDNAKRVELYAMLTDIGYRIIEAENGIRTIDLLRRRRNIALAIIDVSMTDISGEKLISSIRLSGVATPLIVVASQNDEQLIEDALKAGAMDYFHYPISPLRLSVTLRNFSITNTLEREIHFIRRRSENHLRFSDLFAKSDAMKKLLQHASHAASNKDNLLIEGETGTGRETIARVIHHESQFSDGAFVRIQCQGNGFEDNQGYIWNGKVLSLLESGLNGTVCFCDVDALEPVQQKRLTKYLKQKASEAKKGEQKTRFMAIALTNLKDLVKDGLFERELFEMLNQSYVKVPALRDREEDLPDLIQHVVDHIIVESGHPHVSGVSSSALSLLTLYDWTGNVSQLENVLYRAVLISKGPLLMIQDFPQLSGKHMLDYHDEELLAAVDESNKVLVSFLDDNGDVRTFSEIERDIIEKAIDHYDGHISEAARRLKIGRSTLYRKLDEYQEDTQTILNKAS